MLALGRSVWRVGMRRGRSALGLFWFVQGVTEGWHEMQASALRSLDRAVRFGWDGPRVRRARAARLRHLGRLTDAEADLTEAFYDTFGDKVPAALRAELASLRYRLANA